MTVADAEAARDYKDKQGGGMDKEDWYLHFTLRTEIVLPGAEKVVVTSDCHDDGDSKQVVQIDFTKSDDPDLNDLTVQFRAGDSKEAFDRGRWWSEEIAALVSFLASRRARIEKLHISQAPPEPVPLQKYQAIIPPDQFATIAPPPEVNPRDLSILVRTRPERVSRALRWLHRARDTRHRVDEFICLVVALEAVSHLLGEGGSAHWQCARCNRKFKACPACGYSTERKASGAEMLRSFTVGTLGWASADWRAVWKLRNALLHGEEDVSSKLMREKLPALLPKVELAVVAALKKVGDLPATHAPTTLSPRPFFTDPLLLVEYVPPETPHRRAPSSGDVVSE